MKHTFTLISLFMAAFLSGCGTIPQNAADFRTQVQESSMATVDTFEVKRPYQDVTKTFEKYVGKCLNVSMESTTCYNGGGCSTTVQNYNPTLMIGKSKMQLYVQVEMPNAVMLGSGKMPEKGMYIVVTDAEKVDSKTTKLDIYRGRFGYDTLQKAIRGWANGDIKGCPDLTQG
jgi:hypothetical protein